jgi:hypothetical protein
MSTVMNVSFSFLFASPPSPPLSSARVVQCNNIFPPDGTHMMTIRWSQLVLLLSQFIAPPSIRPQKTIAQQTTNDYFVLFLLLRQQLAIFNRGDDFVAPRLLLLHFVIMQGTKYICYPFEWLNC